VLKKICSLFCLAVKEFWLVSTDKDQNLTPFRIDIQLEGLQNVRSGEVVNIGTGGMFLSIHYPIPKVGRMVEFSIRFESTQSGIESLIGSAVVRFVREKAENGLPVGCGVEFKQLTPESTDTLARMLEVLKIKEFIPEG
jgi:hypothetical protein